MCLLPVLETNKNNFIILTFCANAMKKNLEI